MKAFAISTARWPDDLETAQALLRGYARFLVASPVAAAGFCFSGFEAEIQGLPGKFATGKAVLLIARISGQDAGCVALTRRALPDGTTAVELKRLWVEPRFRGCGVGRGLILAGIEWARSQGDGSVVLDTVHEAMPEATALYRSLGFHEINRFNDNPVEGVHFYQLIVEHFRL